NAPPCGGGGGGGRGGGPSPPHPRKKSDPDGSPLESWYRPCGLFLPSRTFPSGPFTTLVWPRVQRKPESQFAANPPYVALIKADQLSFQKCRSPSKTPTRSSPVPTPEH